MIRSSGAAPCHSSGANDCHSGDSTNIPHLTVRGISNLMAKITKLQKFGITVLVLSPVIGLLGTVASIYLSFSALDVAENSGIGAVGDHIRNALLFTVGGIIGCLIGLVLFFVGRAKN